MFNNVICLRIRITATAQSEDQDTSTTYSVTIPTAFSLYTYKASSRFHIGGDSAFGPLEDAASLPNGDELVDPARPVAEQQALGKSDLEQIIRNALASFRFFYLDAFRRTQGWLTGNSDFYCAEGSAGFLQQATPVTAGAAWQCPGV